MMNKDFSTALMEWATPTVDFLHSTATNSDNLEFDLAFYAFQTEPKYQPNVVYLGVNPGGDAYSYSQQYLNPVWNLVEYKKMIPERFVKANPCIENLGTWKLWKELQKSFKDYEFFNDYVYMNLAYFNTPNVHNLINRKDGLTIFEKNVQFTKKVLVDIIKPKVIICLGTSNCFDYLKIKGEVLHKKGAKRLVVKGTLGDIPVFGIPHPSGSRTSNVDKVTIGQIIQSNLPS